MPLTALTLKNIKPKEKPFKLSDGHGLYVLVHNNGGIYFRMDYSFRKKRKTLSLGVYPELSLSDARDIAQKIRNKVANGVDPSEEKRKEKINNSFSTLSEDWLRITAKGRTSESNARIARRISLHVAPYIGEKHIEEIKRPDCSAVLKRLIDKGYLRLANQICSDLNNVFLFSIDLGILTINPAYGLNRMIPSNKVKHHPAIIDPRQLSCLLKAIWNYQGSFLTVAAMKLSAYLFARPGEIRTMQWKDVDLVAKSWKYRVTKTSVDHICPLSNQSVDILRELQPLTGDKQFVFPGQRNPIEPMSNNTVRKALRILGFDNDTQTPHGFRSIASTILNEHGFNFDAIEAQLAHSPRDNVRKSYNRARYLPERIDMIQWYSNYLDKLRLDLT
jgi:integrase